MAVERKVLVARVRRVEAEGCGWEVWAWMMPVLGGVNILVIFKFLVLYFCFLVKGKGGNVKAQTVRDGCYLQWIIFCRQCR